MGNGLHLHVVVQWPYKAIQSGLSVERKNKMKNLFSGEEIVGMHSLLMVMVFTQIHYV